MIAMRNTSLRTRTQRAWSDFRTTTKNDNYQYGFRHGLVVGVTIISAAVLIAVAALFITSHQPNTTSPPVKTSQFYILNEDGTIKMAVGQKPSEGSYFQDEERFSKEVELGYDVAIYTSPDGVEHIINLQITGTMDIDRRIKLYNQLVHDGTLAPFKSGDHIEALSDYVYEGLTKAHMIGQTHKVAPIMAPTGVQTITIGSTELLDSFHREVIRQPENVDKMYNFDCQIINLTVENEKSYGAGLLEYYKGFDGVYWTYRTSSVASRTAEPCFAKNGITPPGEPPQDSYAFFENNGISFYAP